MSLVVYCYHQSKVLSAQFLYSVPIASAYLNSDSHCNKSYQLISAYCYEFIKLHQIEQESLVAVAVFPAVINVIHLLVALSVSSTSTKTCKDLIIQREKC
uniref:Uncharacterized protein n=1 Tax=Acrobeloides nanus TaxID=290746 RepID=A0A914D6Z2_9BILA